MKFGLQASRVATLEELRQTVAWAERTGFEALFLPDHLLGTKLAVAPALAIASTCSTRLRLGSLVYANDFRNPLLLAKEAATLQQLTGRFVCGLGTGWNEREYDAAGLRLDPPGVRVARLEEALHLLKRAWSGESFSFQGEFYQVRDYLGVPAARPHLMLGGGGRRMVELAGREADMVSLNARIGADFDVYTDRRLEEQLGWLGSSRAERSLAVYYGRAGEDTGPDLERYALERGFTAEQARHSPLFLFGEPARVAERIARLESEFGISMLILSQYGCDLESFAPLVAQSSSSN